MCRTGLTYRQCACGKPITCAYEQQCPDCAAALYEEMFGDG